MRRVLARQEALIGLAIVVIAAVFAVLAPAFLTPDHVFTILRGIVPVGIMALGLLVVLIGGGIDISVSAVAVTSMYVTVTLLGNVGYQGPVILAIVISCAFGAVLGLINGALVSVLHLPALIVTLGTLTLYRGALLAFVGTERINILPAQMVDFSRASLLTVPYGAGRSATLPFTVLILVALAVALALVLRYTTWGRALYAMGDDENNARRHGVNVVRVRLVSFVISGALAGVAGVVWGSMNRSADPFSIVGSELDVLAAAVIGGASIVGGRGTVIGTVLGVLLVGLIGSSLTLIGVPSEWRQAFIGAFLLLAIGLPALRRRLSERQNGIVVSIS